MKTINLKNYLLALLASVAIVSCVQDDDFSVPESVGTEENKALTVILDSIATTAIDVVTISELKAMYNSDPNGDGDNYDAIPFRVDTDIVIIGYVSTSDLTGNFYKELYLQDSPENPTAAIKVILSQVDSYNRFNKGREVYIRLRPETDTGAPTGLYIGEERTGNEVITIGGGTESDQYGTTVTSLTQSQMNATMFRSELTQEIIPLNVQFSQIESAHIGMFVQIDNVEFEDNLDGQRYFDPLEDYDTQRTMQFCSGFNYSLMKLETSGFANFKNEMLPTGNGSVAGVVSKTYDGSSLILALNTTDDIDFSGACCELLTTLFAENFETNFTTWTVFSVTGSQVWSHNSSGNPGYCAAMSGYSSGSTSENEDWLITPAIDLSEVSSAVLAFQTAKKYSGNELEVYMCTDYLGGDPNDSGSWVPLSVTLSSGDWDWTDSGTVDVSAAAGENLFVAFKYTCTGSSSATYKVDNVKVFAP